MPTRSARTRLQAGFTLTEAITATATVLIVVALLIPMFGNGLSRSGVYISANNLRRISMGCAAYEASWGGRQWSKLDPAMGLYNGCTPYAASTCPPVLTLGQGNSGGLWGYWIRGTQSQCTGYPGTCSNWPFIMPMPIGGTTGNATSGAGTWSLINARGVREYITSRFYDPVFYSPNDVLPYQQLQSTHFSSPDEFTYSGSGSGGVFWESSYKLSPAALWGVGVFRRPSEGGFQAPDDFPGAYQTPTASAATYPSLKTRLMEGRWCQNPPAITHPGGAVPTPYLSNCGPGSTPVTAFFDGHVSLVSMSTFAADDAAVTKQTGDGLWSRDTPVGAGGLYPQWAIGDFRNSSHILTTGGITGRDLLESR
jgi:hypothetical protein